MIAKSMLAACAASALLACAAEAADPEPAKLPADVVRGKYLVQVAGCNDCHTPGYLETAGEVEESKWLTGTALGWRGPWGTTYAPNLRLSVKDMTADQFVERARSPQRPPMPWFNLRDMRDGDVKAIYAHNSIGLLGMRERALSFGGTTEVTGLPGGGTLVSVRIPAK